MPCDSPWSASWESHYPQGWYREQLRSLVPPILAKWEAILTVRAGAWGIERMKTKWGAWAS
jgi:predicted metal-dependent hydrolase